MPGLSSTSVAFGEGFSLAIIEENDDRSKLSPSQLDIFSSSELEQFVQEQHGEMRIFDKDQNLAKDKPVWRSLLKYPRGGEPWLFVSNGKTGYSGPLPATTKDTLAIAKKYKVK